MRDDTYRPHDSADKILAEGKGGLMNNLNSILIEGTLTGDPLCQTVTDETLACTFNIVSVRYERIKGEFKEEVSCFNIETEGKLAECVRDRGKKGRGVRVVGRLKSYAKNAEIMQPYTVVIVAEHVEFWPEFKKTNSTKKKQ